MRGKEAKIVKPTPVAKLLTDAINRSGKSQAQICNEVGLEKSNIITMFKQGRTPFPLTRVVAFSKVLDIREEDLMIAALQSVYPNDWKYMATVIGNAVKNNFA